MQSHTVTTVLPASRREVFAYMSEIENLPEWATEFARELRREEDGYTVVNNLGEFRFEIRADEETGVIDMFAGPTADQMAGSRPARSSFRTGTRPTHSRCSRVRGCRTALRGPVRIAQARVREHRSPVRLADRLGQPPVTGANPDPWGAATPCEASLPLSRGCDTRGCL